jgi:hypothetical protein
MSSMSTKTCRTCYMEIDSRARKCPHCHQWQGKLDKVILNPGFAALLGIIPLLIFAAVMIFCLQPMFDQGRDFQSYRDQIEVTQSEIKFGQDNCGPTVVVLGTVQNHSDVTWKDVQFAVEFFDKDKKLADADQTNKYFSVFPANDQCAFTVSFRRQFPQEQYVTGKARVVSARDARARF